MHEGEKKGPFGERVARGREGASASLLWRLEAAEKEVERRRCLIEHEVAGSESRLGGVGRFGLEMFCRWIKSRYRSAMQKREAGL